MAESPDPLVGYRWREPSVTNGLQLYVLRPVAVSAVPALSFENLSAAPTGQGTVLVKGTGSLRFDFGVESAAWLEFDSPDLSGSIEMSISSHYRSLVPLFACSQQLRPLAHQSKGPGLATRPCELCFVAEETRYSL